jgi:hypothetical protein
MADRLQVTSPMRQIRAVATGDRATGQRAQRLPIGRDGTAVTARYRCLSDQAALQWQSETGAVNGREVFYAGRFRRDQSVRSISGRKSQDDYRRAHLPCAADLACGCNSVFACGENAPGRTPLPDCGALARREGTRTETTSRALRKMKSHYGHEQKKGCCESQ